MNYYVGLIIRLVLAFVPAGLFSFFLTPLTIYTSYLVLASYHPTIVANSLVINNISFQFIGACIAVYAYYFLWLLCLLTKDILLKDRIKIIFFGFFLIFTMNILRIALVIILATDYGFFWFNLVHLFFWKFLSGVYVALVWIMLVKVYRIEKIPAYDDLKTLYKASFRSKKFIH